MAPAAAETFLANVNQPKSAHNFIVLNFDEVFAIVVQYVSHMNLLSIVVLKKKKSFLRRHHKKVFRGAVENRVYCNHN